MKDYQTAGYVFKLSEYKSVHLKSVWKALSVGLIKC